MAREQVANTWIVSLDTILDAYEDIGERLPSFIDHQSLFEKDKYMRKALEDYYCDILTFNYHAMKFITRPGKLHCLFGTSDSNLISLKVGKSSSKLPGRPSTQTFGRS